MFPLHEYFKLFDSVFLLHVICPVDTQEMDFDGGRFMDVFLSLNTKY